MKANGFGVPITQEQLDEDKRTITNSIKAINDHYYPEKMKWQQLQEERRLSILRPKNRIPYEMPFTGY